MLYQLSYTPRSLVLADRQSSLAPDRGPEGGNPTSQLNLSPESRVV